MLAKESSSSTIASDDVTAIDAAIPRTLEGTEPFHAVYRRDRCLPAIESVLQAGMWRVDSWFPSINIHYLLAEEVLDYDPSGLAFWNVNTPEEFLQAERIAAGMGQEPKL
jgi:molybdopterin-guanine dinucleotide biosynthesis protein A